MTDELIERYSGYIAEALRDTDRELYNDDGLKATVGRVAVAQDGTFNTEAFYQAFMNVTKDSRVVPAGGRGITTYWHSTESTR